MRCWIVEVNMEYFFSMIGGVGLVVYLLCLWFWLICGLFDVG